MASVTMQVLEGLERGRVFADLPTPVTIGREDDNVIRLNDERVSRFHAKVQEDGGRIILTDLDSTNGTRVNGYPVQLRVLQIGDQVSIGRCLLLYGSPEEILARRRELTHQGHGPNGLDGNTASSAADEPFIPAQPIDEAHATFDGRKSGEVERDLFPYGAPEVPQDLLPVQRAQLADLLAYVHEQLGHIANSAIEEHHHHGPGTMRVNWENWQRLLKLEMDLAQYLREIYEPDC